MGWLTWKRGVRIWCGSLAGFFLFFALWKIGGGEPPHSWIEGLGYSAAFASFVILVISSFISKTNMARNMFFKD